jgi:hypothetical protein
MPKLHHFLLLAFIAVCLSSSVAQMSKELLLSEIENAYNPIPSPDGKLIAYVRTGWNREHGSGGFGRSNLRSEIAVMNAKGEILTQSPLGDAFLFGWTQDSSELVCYRDGRFSLVRANGGTSQNGRDTDAHLGSSEQVAYLSKADTFIWLEHEDWHTQVLTRKGKLAEIALMTGDLVIPSPDERYIAVAGNKVDLWVLDTETKKWANLGRTDIHPYSGWDYIKPTWNPWFADSSRIVFFSGSRLIVASPDGERKETLLEIPNSGLPVPSPDGKRIGYVTFSPRPMKLRRDLSFWGDSTLWVVSADGKRVPQQITSSSTDTTYDLRWLGNDRLIFDRLSDEPFYSHARLWTVSLPKTKR